MNHLAHIFLSHHHPHLLLGNFIADMVSPTEKKEMPEIVLHGIDFHHFIDRTVDDHPMYKECIKIIRPSQLKYAPVTMDIFADFLLVENWSSYHSLPFEFFKSKAYEDLLNGLILQENHRLHKRIKSMIENNFLTSYEHKSQIPFVFKFLQKRARYENNFKNALEDYERHHEILTKTFNIFFNELDSIILPKYAEYKIRSSLRN